MSTELVTKIYTDGSCPKNPGGAGGYGVVIIYGGVIREISGHIQAPTTSNRAELTAVIVGLFQAQIMGAKNIEVYSDSQYVVNTLTGMYKRRVNNDLWDLADLAIKNLYKFKIYWVRGHNGDKYNEKADKLAGEGTLKYYVPTKDEEISGISSTTIGQRLKPKMKPTEVNKFLINEGYQTKLGSGYQVTIKGKDFAIEDDYMNADGGLYTKFTWKPSIITELQTLIKNND